MMTSNDSQDVLTPFSPITATIVYPCGRCRGAFPDFLNSTCIDAAC
jgi:cytidine deaminase